MPRWITGEVLSNSGCWARTFSTIAVRAGSGDSPKPHPPPDISSESRYATPRLISVLTFSAWASLRASVSTTGWAHDVVSPPPGSFFSGSSLEQPAGARAITQASMAETKRYVRFNLMVFTPSCRAAAAAGSRLADDSLPLWVLIQTISIEFGSLIGQVSRPDTL